MDEVAKLTVYLDSHPHVIWIFLGFFLHKLPIVNPQAPVCWENSSEF